MSIRLIGIVVHLGTSTPFLVFLLTFQFSSFTSARSLVHHTLDIIRQNPVIIQNSIYIHIVEFRCIFLSRRGDRHANGQNKAQHKHTHGEWPVTNQVGCLLIPGTYILPSLSTWVTHYATPWFDLRLRNTFDHVFVYICLMTLSREPIVMEFWSIRYQTQMLRKRKISSWR